MATIFGICAPGASRRFPANQIEAAAQSMIPRSGARTRFVRTEDFLLALVLPSYSGAEPAPIVETEEQVVCIDGEIYDFRAVPGCASYNRLPRALEEYLRNNELDTLRELYGNFNIVQWKKRERRLAVLSDFFGCKPLYWQEKDDSVRFASEFKPLLRLYDARNDTDIEGIRDYFRFSHTSSDRTFFRSIKRFPYRSCFTIAVGDSGCKVSRKSFPRPEIEMLPEDMESVLDHLDASYTKIFDDHAALPGDKCVFLTGGLDSRAIAGGLDRAEADFSCATYGQSFSWDVKYGRSLAEAIGRPWHFHRYSPESFVRGFTPGVLRTEGQINGIHLSTSGLVEEISEYSTVVYDGLLMDKLTGANLRFFTKDSPFVDLTPESALRITGNLSILHPDYARILFRDEFIDDLDKQLRDDAEAFYEENKRANVSDALTEHVIRNRTRHLLPLNGLMARSDYVMTRYPYVSLDLYKTWLSVPVRFLENQEAIRQLFVKRLPKVASVPWQYTGRSLAEPPQEKYLHRQQRADLLRHYLRRLTGGLVNLRDPKSPAHLEEWMRQNRRFREFFLDILRSQGCAERGFYKPDGIEKLIELQKKGHILFEVLCLVATFELFHSMILEPSGTADS
jgi:asparagine synthetase B (glutamine-hydrolysing)